MKFNRVIFAIMLAVFISPLGCQNNFAAEKTKGMFDVRYFGAKGDGEQLDTKAIQAAIDACNKNGGGTVFFSAGKYLTGTIFIKSNVTLYLAAETTLLGSKKLSDYATDIKGCPVRSWWDKCLIYAEDARNIAMTGQGTIDGQGQAFPGQTPQGEKAERPMLMRFVNCKNIYLTDLTFKDAASFCSNFISCDGIKIDGIKIHNRANANNDGLNLYSCQNVFISNCNMSCGDDVIALQNSARNIVITNCVMSSRWAAFRFGLLSLGSFENITVSNCVIYDTFGSAIKLQMNEGGRMENITFSNLVMDNVTGPISMRLAGNLGVPRRPKRKESLPIGTLRNVLFSNIRARMAEKAEVERRRNGEQRSCISITGLPGHNIEAVTLSNIHITYPGGGTSTEAARREIPELKDVYPEYFMFGVLPAYGLYARHATGLTLNNVRFDLAGADMRPAIVCDDVEDLEISGFRGQGNPAGECLIRLQQTRQAFIHGCRPLSNIKTFLRVEGASSKEITLTGNNLHRAKTAVETVDGAKSKAVITSASSTTN